MSPLRTQGPITTGVRNFAWLGLQRISIINIGGYGSRIALATLACPGRRDLFRDPNLISSNFPHIEITGILSPNVSSRALQRNNSLPHETIFPFSSRHPETEAH
ncbi:hypothetical protein V1290_003409 [Bradyrhizobium sp. AZCC 1578]